MLYREKWILPLPPIMGNVYGRLVGAAEERYDVPPHWAGSLVQFTCVGDDIYLLFGDATVTVVPATYSGLAAEVLTSSKDTGLRIIAGETAQFWIPDKAWIFDDAGNTISRDTIDHFCVEGVGAASAWLAHAVTRQHTSFRD